MGASSWKAPPGWRQLRLQVFARYGRACYRCGRYANTVDHAVPVALGGQHAIGNLRPACGSCNSSTGASMGNKLRPRRQLPAAQRRAIAAKGQRPVIARSSAPPLRTSRNW